MKRQQETVGSIVQIHINDEFYVYAQILPHGLLAFFDYKSDTELSDLNVLKNAKVLFITAVYKYVTKVSHPFISAIWVIVPFGGWSKNQMFSERFNARLKNV